MNFKKRHSILVGIIIGLIVWIIVFSFLKVEGGFLNEQQIERINSVESKDNFCFAVMGDNQEGFGVFKKIIENINEKKPLFAIDNGDIVQDGKKSSYKVFYNEILRINVPFLTAIGNHDIKSNGRMNYYNMFGNFYYSFAYNNSLFIILDDANQKNVDDFQLRFVEDELKKDYKNKFVFMHVPAFEPEEYVSSYKLVNKARDKIAGSLSDKKNVNEFMKIIDKYNVTAVFSGHIHGYFNDKINNTNYIISAGAGGPLVMSNPDHYFYNYVNVCVNKDKVNYEIVKFSSPLNNTLEKVAYVFYIYTVSFILSNMTVIILVIILLMLVIDLFYGEIRRFYYSSFRRHKRIKVRV